MRRKVRVYDNGGKTFDRYTVLIKRVERGQPVYDIYTMSEEQGPQGFNMYSHTEYEGVAASRFEKEGKRMKVHDLPLEVIQAIEYRI